MASSLDSPTSSESSSFDPYTTDIPEEQPNSPQKSQYAGADSAHVAGSTSGRKRKRPAAYVDGSADQLSSSSDNEPFDNGDTQNMGPNFRTLPYGVDRNKRAKPDGTAWHPGISPNKDLPSQGITVNKSNVPEELWQYIFTFLPPSSLARAMSVNKLFNSLLTPSGTELVGHRPTPGLLQYISPSSIWCASRKAFYPGMPRPLSFRTELDMLKLVLGNGCQFCSEPGSAQCDNSEHADVQIIWPFGVRACKKCIHSRTEKEVDLLFSSLPSLLVPGLPFAFFAPNMDYVSSVAFRTGRPPSSLTKHFFKTDIDQLKGKFDEVKALGAAAAEEWIKGLEGASKAKLQDAARFEQWELAGGLTSIRTAQHHVKSSPAISPVDAGNNSASVVDTTSGHSTPHTNSSEAIKKGGAAATTRPGFKAANNFTSSDNHQQLQPNQNSKYHKPGERNLRQVNEAKANRKAEIERRCLELQPPLTPGVLSHMDAFMAAIQIPHPFTDQAWELLRPRLLAQRNFAERKEQERIQHEQILQARTEERRQQEAQLKEAKEALDREWEVAQAPIKERLATYADEIIREGWRGGDAVTKEKCPKFAADVLIYVRDRFYSDLAKNDALARSAGKPIVEDPPNAPPTRRIILENMKFIFDTKIKPLTEQFQKELFLCNGCENNTKFYGFEGVVQHYAAKHTNVLSLGSVVVHWRAEWPETPPFNPNPNAAKALLYSMPRGGVGYPNQGPGAMYMGPEPHMAPEGGPAYPHPSPGPYRRTPYGTPYPYGSGPYRPPSPPSPQFYPGQQAGYGYSPPQPGYAAAAPYDAHPQPPQMYGSPYPGQAYPPPYAPPDSRGQAPYPPPPYGPHPGPYGAPYPNSQHPRRGPHPPNQQYGFPRAQVDEMAKIARSVWNGTSGIRDLPHNVRAFVLIHHVIARFTERLGDSPPLPLFAEGLNGHPQMKPIRNLSGLVCKACNGAYQPSIPLHDLGRGDGKMYTLPALVSHFLSTHMDRPTTGASLETGAEVHTMDWKSDMLALPDNSTVLALADAPGMDENKLKLFAAAFPWIFPATQEKPMSQRRVDSRSSQRGVVTRPSPHRGIEVAVDNFPSFVESPSGDDAKPLEPPRDDEYDPHKPAFIEPIGDQFGGPNSRRFKPKNTSARGKGRLDSRGIPRKHRAGDMHETGSGVDFERFPPRSSGYLSGSAHSQASERQPKLEYDEPSGVVDAPKHEQKKARTPAGVSEDGEVEDAPPSGKERINGSPPAEGTTAAEHFLSTFAPSHEHDEYKASSTREFNRHAGNPSKGRWLDATDHDNHRWHAEGGSRNSSVGGTPTQAIHHKAWGKRARSPAAGGYQEYESRHEYVEGAGMLRHGDDTSPVHGDHRPGRRAVAYSESRHTPDYPSRRPHSRFDRYEAQRQNTHRTRSRSPAVHDPAALEQAYYRDRSPKPRYRQRAYAGHPSEAYYERAPLDQPPVTYTRVPRRAHYQYVDDPRYAPEPPYDGGVEYVAVAPAEPQPAGAYYIERPVQREMPKEYVDYEMDYPQPPPGHHTQYYPSSTMPPSMQGQRQARYR